MGKDRDEQDAAAEAEQARLDAERKAEEEFLRAREEWRQQQDAKARVKRTREGLTAPDPPRSRGEAQAAGKGSSSTAAGARLSPTSTLVPGSASRRTSASAMGPRAGETAQLRTCPTVRSPTCRRSPCSAGADRHRPRRRRFALPL